jgi:hypothetical protein
MVAILMFFNVKFVLLLLVRSGARVNATDADRRTALQSAAWQGHSAVVKFLLENGADVDHACNQGATALSISAQEGHIENIKLLLDHGANPAHSDACGRSALRMAVKGGHAEAAKLLEERLGPLAAAALATPGVAKQVGNPARNSTGGSPLLPDISAKPPTALLNGGSRLSGGKASPAAGRFPVDQDDQSPDSTCEMPNNERRYN